MMRLLERDGAPIADPDTVILRSLDRLSVVYGLLDALYMASESIADREEANGLTTLTMITQEQVTELKGWLESVRADLKGGAA